jgi:hypothetical protein
LPCKSREPIPHDRGTRHPELVSGTELEFEILFASDSDKE